MVFEEDLIEEIRKHPGIYDRHSPLYSDKPAKDVSWQVISRNIGISEEACRRRWKSLRDRFVRYCNHSNSTKTGAACDEGLPPWIYFEKLKFLKNHVTRKNVYRRREDESFPSMSDIREESAEVYLPESNETIENPLSFAQTPLSSPNTGSNFEADDSAIQENTAKRKKIEPSDEVNKLLEQLSDFIEIKSRPSTTHNRESRHEAFLRLIEDYFNKVPEDEIDNFKFDILRYVHEKYNELKHNTSMT